MSSFGQFDFGVQDDYSSFKAFPCGAGGNKGKQTCFNGTEDWKASVNMESHCFDDFHFDIVSPPIQPCLEEITKPGEIPVNIPDTVQPKKGKQYPFHLSSLELLNSYRSRFKRMNGQQINQPIYQTACKAVGPELSTEEILRVAGAKFIQSYSEGVHGFTHSYGSYFSGLSDEEIINVELAVFLLAAAEKVSNQHFDSANKLLSQCGYLSSSTGNPVQRVVYYFSEALQGKIDQETGRITSKGLGKKRFYDIDEAMMSPNPTILTCHEAIPFCQIALFPGIQAIVENVANAKKVHVIDLGIRNGVQWTILMQALAARQECPIELLKITAVGTALKQEIEDTGKRLLGFAQTMNLPFSFKVVMVSDMLELTQDLFELEAEELVAVYSHFILRTMLARPNRLESLMKVIKNINPCIMLVQEVEANINSIDFVSRFIEALYFFGAYFDCLETCMDRNDPNRMITESMYFGQGIWNIVATEGEERTIRHVKIHVWRAFFARFGMVETELSTSSLYQARLVVKKFACGNSCTLDMDGKCLLIGWKGTPIQSLSVWKFL